MERGGISSKGVLHAISNRPPAPCHFTRKSNMIIIYIALFTTFAIDYFSAALTGSFIWESADTQVPRKIPLSRIADGSHIKVAAMTREDYNNPFSLVNYVSQIMTMASASASITWGRPEDIPTASHSPKGEWQHMRFTVDTVSQDREGSTHLS